jgi:threonine dehydrogenase-like Zn-dependent dehydrogenase
MSRPESMLGLFKTARGPGNMELRTAPVPTIKPNEALLEIKATGICGTEIPLLATCYHGPRVLWAGCRGR